MFPRGPSSTAISIAKVGHQRRYRRPELRAKLERARFEPRTLSYRNIVGAVGWLVLGRFLKNKGVGKGSVWLHDRVVFPIARLVEDRVPLPYGLNLLCIARKPAGTKGGQR